MGKKKAPKEEDLCPACLRPNDEHVTQDKQGFPVCPNAQAWFTVTLRLMAPVMLNEEDLENAVMDVFDNHAPTEVPWTDSVCDRVVKD